MVHLPPRLAPIATSLGALLVGQVMSAALVIGGVALRLFPALIRHRLFSAVWLRLFSTFIRFFPLVLRGRWSSIPNDLPTPTVKSVTTATGPHQVLAWNEGKPGTPIVCLHGFNGSPWMWGRLAGILVAEYHVDQPIFAIALLGHGNDAQQMGISTDPESLAQGVCEVLDALHVGRCHLLGHSWGGKVALYMAAARASRVQSAVLCDPVLPQGLAPVNALVEEVVQLAFFPERRAFPSQAALDAGRHHVLQFGHGSDGLDLALWNGMYRQDGDGWFRPILSDRLFRDLVRHCLMADITPMLPLVGCPILNITPDFTIANWPGALGPLRSVPHVAFKSIDGDHNFPHSNPQDLAALVVGHLEEGSRDVAPKVASKLANDRL